MILYFLPLAMLVSGGVSEKVCFWGALECY
jgi:hypothetical protein